MSYDLKVYLGIREPAKFTVENEKGVAEAIATLMVPENANVPVVSSMGIHTANMAGNLTAAVNVTYSLPFGMALKWETYQKIVGAYHDAGFFLLDGNLDKLDPNKGVGQVLWIFHEDLVKQLVTITNMPGAYSTIEDVLSSEGLANRE